jgi:hypothetical protein
MHHLWEVNAGGGDALANLVALCPTCHALYHRGTIRRESIYAWKAMLVAIGRAFDVGAIDQLMFLSLRPRDDLAVSGDGILMFSRLIAAGLVSYSRIRQPHNPDWPVALDMSAGFPILYSVELTPKGVTLVEAWKKGDRGALQTALAPASLPALTHPAPPE